MKEDTGSLSGLRKASVLIMCLGPETSWKVFEQLSPEQQDLIGAEILRLRRVDDATRTAVMEEVSERLSTSADADARSRRRAAAQEHGEWVQGESGPVEARGLRDAFGWVESLQATEAAAVLADSDPYCAAVVLMGVSAGFAEVALSCMASDAQEAISERMGKLGRVSGETVEAIEKSIRLKLALLRTGDGSRNRRRGLFGVLARVVHKGDASDRPRRLGRRTGGLIELDAASLPTDVDPADLCVVLRLSDEKSRAALLKRLPLRQAAEIRRELSVPAPVTVAQAEAVRERISRRLS